METLKRITLAIEIMGTWAIYYLGGNLGEYSDSGLNDILMKAVLRTGIKRAERNWTNTRTSDRNDHIPFRQGGSRLRVGVIDNTRIRRRRSRRGMVIRT